MRYSVDLVAAVKPRLFESLSDDQLLGYGVPVEWLADVRRATEDTLLSLTDHLPSEAAVQSVLILGDLEAFANPIVINRPRT